MTVYQARQEIIYLYIDSKSFAIQTHAEVEVIIAHVHLGSPQSAWSLSVETLDEEEKAG